METYKVLVGMSGGVDSSVAALLLQNVGHQVGGVTLKLCEKDDEKNLSDAAEVCKRFSIEHYVIDLKKEFGEFVVKSFIEEYVAGNTPNPCIECNRHIKFGKMLDKAEELGYEKIATGHYARIVKNSDGRYLLLKGADPNKDQSYVLYNLTQKQLSKIIFPLGELTKSQIRETALSNGLVNANRPDSQDICFVPDGDYASFIEGNSDYASKKGDYVDINGNYLGEHLGVIHYTIGQRKGLGIALGKPQFVLEKDAQSNRVVLGDEEHLFKREVLVKEVNFIPFDNLVEPIRVEAKLRYRHTQQKATLYPMDNNMVKLVFDEPQRAASSGQAAVFYDGELVIGGGTII